MAFGLGQTRTEWLIDIDAPQQIIKPPVKKTIESSVPKPTQKQSINEAANPSVPKPGQEQEQLSNQQQELKQFFFSRKKRRDGERAEKAAESGITSPYPKPDSINRL